MGDHIRSHHAILQRLDTPVDYGSHTVIYSRAPFVDSASRWDNIPVIYANAQIHTGHHPDFSDVSNGTLPAGYTVVGRIRNPCIVESGAERLEADIEIDDAYRDISDLANLGGLAISTGFTCPQYQTGADGQKRPIYALRGSLVPNHVLVFRQGATPGSYARDNAAMFVNSAADTTPATEVSMENNTQDPAEELRGLKKLLQPLADWIVRTGNNSADAKSAEAPEEATGQPEPMPSGAPETPAAPEQASEPAPENAPMRVPQSLVACVNSAADAQPAATPAAPSVDEINDREALLEELQQYRQERQDRVWTRIREYIPAGWLSNGEDTLRAEHDASPDEFYLKILAHTTQYTNSRAVADGATVTPTQAPTGDAALQAEIDRIDKKYGWA